MAWFAGTFSRARGASEWQTDAANAVPILANLHDAQDNDLASGINDCLNKNGQNALTAPISLGGFNFTNVGNATARNQFPSYGQVQDGAAMWAGTSAGTADAQTVTLTPAPAPLTAGLRISFLAGATNTGALTINPNGIGPIAVKLSDGITALVAGDVTAGYLVHLFYDGTIFRLINAAIGAGPGMNQREMIGVGATDSPALAGLTISGLTASSPIVTDGSKALVSQTYAGFKTSLAISTTDLTGTLTTWSPTVTGSGSISISALSVYDKSYEKAGNWVHFQLAMGFTVGGVGSTIYITTPTTPVNHDPGSLYIASQYLCRLQNAANASSIGAWHITSGKIETFIPGGGTNLTAAATYITIDGKYRVA